MDPAVIVTLVVSVSGVIFASVTAPLILAHRTERMHREDMLSDYQRQDRVAAAAAAAVAAAQAATAAMAAHTVANSAKLDDLAVQTQRIHTLVNSDMTAARQEELDQADSLILVLDRVIALAKSRDIEPDPSDLETLERTKRRREQLELILADRLAQFRASEEEARQTAAGQNMLAHDNKAKRGKEDKT